MAVIVGDLKIIATILMTRENVDILLGHPNVINNPRIGTRAIGMDSKIVLVFFNGKMPFVTTPFRLDVYNIACLICFLFHFCTTLGRGFKKVILTNRFIIPRKRIITRVSACCRIVLGRVPQAENYLRRITYILYSTSSNRDSLPYIEFVAAFLSSGTDVLRDVARLWNFFPYHWIII